MYGKVSGIISFELLEEVQNLLIIYLTRKQFVQQEFRNKKQSKRQLGTKCSQIFCQKTKKMKGNCEKQNYVFDTSVTIHHDLLQLIFL